MQYSFVAATLFSGAVMASVSPVNQIPDGQLQVPASSVKPATTAAPVYETKTAYSTNIVTITSCSSDVISCPARTLTTSYPVVTSSLVAPASTTKSAKASTTVVPVVPVVPVYTQPAAPVVPVVSASYSCPAPQAVTVTVTVSGVPAASAPAVPAVPAVPVVPASPASPSSPAVPAVPVVPASPASPANPSSPVVGAASPTGTGSVSGAYSPPIVSYAGGAASTFGASFGVAGLAAMAAIFLA